MQVVRYICADFILVVGLRWSGLTMGSILIVCLAGASTSVTVEADARVTISVAEVACVFCPWSVIAVTLLSVGPLFRGDLCQLLLP